MMPRADHVPSLQGEAAASAGGRGRSPEITAASAGGSGRSPEITATSAGGRGSPSASAAGEISAGEIFGGAELRTCRHRVALVTGFFGGYDLPYLERLPRCMRGVVYTDRLGWQAARAEWHVRYLLLPGSTHVSPSRLASKYVKFMAFLELAGAAVSAVLYRDMSVRLRRVGAAFELLSRMDALGTDLLLNDWHYPNRAVGERRLWWEIDDVLTNRASHVARSRDNVVAWRDTLRRSGLRFPNYAEGNLLLYRPDAPVVQRVFPKIFAKCYAIERDQFILPWAIHNETGITINRWLVELLNATKTGHLKKHGASNR